ncbi:hypothetical protein [Luteimicrobium sp. DT211]|uniref:hypothetical protein n=1 Tax=Luteimicrobium sp. DT211 TaxID=3393412 RepID=UPI003CFA8D48
MTQTPVTYLDFTLGGERVHDLVACCLGYESDDISALHDGWPDGAIESIERLLGLADPDLPDGRTSIYVCPECGDLGCGAVTARVRFTETTVEWRDLGFQDENFPEITPILDGGAPLSVRFDRASYEEHLERELERFRELAVGWVHPRTVAARRRRRERLARWRAALRRPGR